MRTVAFAAILALTLPQAAASEDFESANSALPGCRDFINLKQPFSAEQGYCAGIVTALTYVGLSLRRSGLPFVFKNDMTWIFCIDMPDRATTGQAVRVVVAFVEAHPERMHESFAKLANEALVKAWPCPWNGP
jgi:hypothetical protein